MSFSTVQLPFDELFWAVESDALAALLALLHRYQASSLVALEARYNLLNHKHPQKELTVLQWGVLNFPKTSIRILKTLLEFGAETEIDLSSNSNYQPTPLWISIEKKFPIEIIRLLLDFKADIFFKSNCHPFTEDEKSFINGNLAGYSLLHLGVKMDVEEEILGLLIDSSEKILLDDQSNHFKETPLILAVKLNNLRITSELLKFRPKLDLKDFTNLTAYDLAAKNQNVAICLEFEEANYVIKSEYYLEILKKSSKYWRRKNYKHVIRDLDSESDELLPVDAYWEWKSGVWCTWKDEYVYRLRCKIDIKEPLYLMESIDLASEHKFQEALKLLLEGIQQERDSEKKMRSANYFQRLLKLVESTTPTLGLLNSLSRTSLVILHDEESHYNEAFSEADSEDSLLYCPVCSHRFERDNRETHLKKCLTSPRNKIIGDRYTNVSRQNLSDGECPICYDEFNGDNSDSGSRKRVVVMNCLCRFHEECIEKWLSRGKQCPYHCE